MMINDLEMQLLVKLEIQDGVKKKVEGLKLEKMREQEALEKEMEECRMYEANNEALERDILGLQREMQQQEEETKDKNMTIEKMDARVREGQEMKQTVKELAKGVEQQHVVMKEKELATLDDVIKDESFIFLLKENVSSFSVFHDYWTEKDNPMYDSNMKITKFNSLVIEHSTEERKHKEEPYKLSKIIHTNSFQYLLTPEEFISKRLTFILDCLWREPEIWKNIPDQFCKIFLILGNKSVPLTNCLLSVLQDQISKHTQSQSSLSIYHHKNTTREHIYTLSNPEHLHPTLDQDSALSQITSDLENFYSQTTSDLFEAEITIKNDNIFLQKR